MLPASTSGERPSRLAPIYQALQNAGLSDPRGPDVESSSTIRHAGDAVWDTARDSVTQESASTLDSSVEPTATFPARNKRKQHSIGEDEESITDCFEIGRDDFEGLSRDRKLQLTSKPKSSNIRVRIPQLVYPKSLYEGWTPPLPRVDERRVLDEFLVEQEGNNTAVFDGAAYTNVKLENFSVYQDNKGDGTRGSRPCELVPLHHLCVKRSNHVYQFDGVLSNGERRRWVQRVSFSLLSIGGYGDREQHSIRDLIWLQSQNGERYDTWYQLGTPAPEYERYHSPFLWLANFAKHFLTFLHCHEHSIDEDCDGEAHEQVHLHHFRERFYQEIVGLHEHDESFQSWLQEFGDTDFRRVVTANVEFLWNEAHNSDLRRYGKHPVWKETFPAPDSLTAVRQHVSGRNNATIVTPFVYSCFQGMPWGRFLEIARPNRTVNASSRTQLNHIQRKPGVNQQPQIAAPLSDRARAKREQLHHGALKFRVGDVVGVKKDQETEWKGKTDVWFAYVQGIDESSGDRQLLKVIWLYEPSDTTCSTMHYPCPRELFFSNNCNCRDAPFDAAEVLCKISVAFFAGPDAAGGRYFVRQKFRTEDSAFLTLQSRDFSCSHMSEEGRNSDVATAAAKYETGTTVIVKASGKGMKVMLEPVEIVGFELQDGLSRALVRKLPRRSRDFSNEGDAPLNELVYTDEVYSVRAKEIQRKCHIRFFTEQEKATGMIPVPYNRNGTADAYFISCEKIGEGSLKPLRQPFPSSLKQGFDPSVPPPRSLLNGLDLFCGGGSFGRGLEEGGAVKNKWAVDYNREAIHTYRANLKDPDDTEIYFGSVNDFLARAIAGRYSKWIPEPGQVDFISAGSPCQGFSRANAHTSSESSQRNCSLVASVTAFVDFYRPKYALLENVLGMAAKGGVRKDQTVFSQLLCTLVGMGYQVQQSVVDAWSHGSGQSRSRLFISIAAQGLALPDIPAHSFSHPPNVPNRCIDRCSNGIEFGNRQFMLTPFQYIAAGQATRDLPFVGDAHPHTCIPHPDHRTSRGHSGWKRTQMTQIPIAPRGQSLVDARRRGRLAKSSHEGDEKNSFRRKPGSKSWTRIDPTKLMPTITTTPYVECAFTGTIVHWDEHRLLTIMEARRAQGIPDHEVLVGSVANQWKIVGNGVARTVALAFGMSLREAWLSNDENTLKQLDAEIRSRYVVELASDTETDPLEAFTGHHGDVTPHAPGSSRITALQLDGGDESSPTPPSKRRKREDPSPGRGPNSSRYADPVRLSVDLPDDHSGAAVSSVSASEDEDEFDVESPNPRQTLVPVVEIIVPKST
ncbi:MAG: DNA methyltransferase Dim-2 [Sclerophora amabilis]|nr:MAG: DNA methyltransferase Dim-2 [Sclerophora amabilis]